MPKASEALLRCHLAAAPCRRSRLLAGYERDGKIIEARKRIGFALDCCPNENARYRRQFGRAVVGALASRPEAEARAPEMSGAPGHRYRQACWPR